MRTRGDDGGANERFRWPFQRGAWMVSVAPRLALCPHRLLRAMCPCACRCTTVAHDSGPVGSATSIDARRHRRHRSCCRKLLSAPSVNGVVAATTSMMPAVVADGFIAVVVVMITCCSSRSCTLHRFRWPLLAGGSAAMPVGADHRNTLRVVDA